MTEDGAGRTPQEDAGTQAGQERLSQVSHSLPTLAPTGETAASAHGDAPRPTPGETVTTNGSKTLQVYEALRDRILDGAYSPGFRLVLSTLAAEFEVSVVPVREAIRRLEAEGLVEYTHNIGAQVSAVDRGEYHDSMVTLALLEGMATALAAPHLSKEQLDHAQALNDEMRALTVSSFSSNAYRSLNGRFHTVLTDACPNQRLLAVMRTEAQRVNMIRRSQLKFSPTSSGESVRQHAHLLEMIRDGAPGPDIEHYAREHKLASMASHLTGSH